MLPIRDVFQLSNTSRRVVSSAEVSVGACDRIGVNSDADVSNSFSSAEVAAVISNHHSWDEGMIVWAIPLAGFVQQFTDVGFYALHSYFRQDLRDRQLEDEHLQRVMFYIERKRRPSKHERMGSLVLYGSFQSSGTSYLWLMVSCIMFQIYRPSDAVRSA